MPSNRQLEIPTQGEARDLDLETIPCIDRVKATEYTLVTSVRWAPGCQTLRFKVLIKVKPNAVISNLKLPKGNSMNSVNFFLCSVQIFFQLLKFHIATRTNPAVQERGLQSSECFQHAPPLPCELAVPATPVTSKAR